ncbi:hypothetical protein J6590_071912 [Homalodisca vitripennis]|nr:hypothetical protein J6590_071912 [Homalodisca vitripennis]
MDETGPVKDSSRVLFLLKHRSGSATVEKNLSNSLGSCLDEAKILKSSLTHNL